MNVLYIATYEGLSGASYSLIGMIEELRKMDINPYVIVLKDGKICEKLEDYAIPYEIVRAYPWVVDKTKRGKVKQKLKWLVKQQYNIKADKKIQKIIRKRDIELVHINAFTASVGLKAAINSGIPCIWHIREFVEEDLGKTFWNKSKAMTRLEMADKVIAISNCVKTKFELISKRTDINVIYNGIPTEKYDHERPEIFSGKTITIIFSGRIDPGKGHQEVIEAIARLDIVYIKQIKLLIIGKSQSREYEQKIKQLVNEKGLESVVDFLGFREDLPQIYMKSDISIIASKAEAFGRVTVEAMMGGTVVIGADTAATKELLGKGLGILYRQGDPIDLANKISYVLRHKKEASLIALNAKKYAMENFTSKKNAEEIYGVYKKVIDHLE